MEPTGALGESPLGTTLRSLNTREDEISSMDQKSLHTSTIPTTPEDKNSGSRVDIVPHGVETPLPSSDC